MVPVRLLLSVFLLLSLGMLANAAPREIWSRALGINNFAARQIVADGSGGAVAVFGHLSFPNEEERLHYTAVWFNSMGRELYRKTFDVPSNAEAGGGIASDLKVIAATRKAIVLWYYQEVFNGGDESGDTSGSKTVVVSRAGDESEVDEVNTIDGLQNDRAVNRYGDAAGFFSFKISEDKTTLILVRTSYR